MMRSLRAQVAVLVAVVMIVTLGAVGLAFVSVTRTEVSRYFVHQRSDESQQPLRIAERKLRESGRDGVVRAVEELAGQGIFLLVIDGAQVIATANPELTNASVTRMPDGMIRIESPQVVVMFKGLSMRSPFGGPDDQVEVFLIPREPDPAELPAAAGTLIGLIRRWVFFVIAAGALAGIGLAFLLARRVTGPLEELTRAVRIMERGDLTVRVTTSARDEVGALAEAFNALASRLGEVEQLRRDMVADIAHELRSPITSMRCEIESVQDGLRPLDRERIDLLHRETLALGRLVDDLQELAVADAGQLRLELTRFDLVSAVNDLADGIRAIAEERQLRLEIADNGGDIVADERRVIQVIRNLMINAIAHAPMGSTVSVVTSREPTHMRVEVIDHGPGIPTGERERIFDRFHRLDPSRSRSTGGAGLGLAIAKTIVDAHGGSIGVKETVGGGATFWLTLPVTPPPHV